MFDMSVFQDGHDKIIEFSKNLALTAAKAKSFDKLAAMIEFAAKKDPEAKVQQFTITIKDGLWFDIKDMLKTDEVEIKRAEEIFK